jgi:hypothetical protein
MLKESLELQLRELRNKWKDFPKDYNDPRWWRFKCDKTLAEQLKTQIKKIEAGIDLEAKDLTEDQIKELLRDII